MHEPQPHKFRKRRCKMHFCSPSATSTILFIFITKDTHWTINKSCASLNYFRSSINDLIRSAAHPPRHNHHWMEE